MGVVKPLTNVNNGAQSSSPSRAILRLVPTSQETVLVQIHREIDGCTVCKPGVDRFQKPKPLDRGTVGRIMVIGEGPGKSELNSGRAFAGQSGRRLEEWLVAAGAPRGNPRQGIYFTSVLKCFCPASKYFKGMARNCSGFLDRQLQTIKPELVITLGSNAFQRLHFTEDEFDRAVCTPYYTGDEVLLTDYGFHFWVLHLPHPSGANRWHNHEANRIRLSSALKFVTRFL